MEWLTLEKLLLLVPVKWAFGCRCLAQDDVAFLLETEQD